MRRRAAPAPGASPAGPPPPARNDVEDALARAASTRSAAVTLALPAPAVPFAALVAALGGAGTYVAWREPTGRIRAGSGAALRIALDGAGTLDAATGLARRLPVAGSIRELAIGGADSVPLRAYAGGAFDPRGAARARDGGWSGWPGSMAVLPRLLYESDGRRAALALVRLAEDTDEDDSRNAGRALELVTALAAPWRVPPVSATVAEPRKEDASAWTDAVASALDAMRRGRLEKVVLARARDARLADEDAAAAVASRLDARTRDGTLVAIGHSGGTFLAATPETLVSRRGSRVSADALAGTAGRNDPARLGGKEHREQALVVDAVRASLAPFCSRVEVDESPSVARADGALHLRTRVRGELSAGASVVEIAAALHPTPAVAGTPREAALEWLRRHEGLDRGWYAGPLGWFDTRGDGRFVVLLRCVRLTGSRARVFAGAGLVEGSEAAAELEETELKMAPILDALETGS